jgi:predicted Zn-dependent peptidase
MDTPSLHHINGHTVILHPTPSKTVFIECSVNAGFMQETKETSGLNHLLEHLLTEAWTKCGKSCSEYWNLKGVPMNASTEMTLMTYYVSGLTTYVKEMIAYIGTITDKPVFKLASLAKEKEAVIDELLALDNDPSSKLLDTLYQNFYKGGIQYSENYKLQIANLSHFTISDIKAAYNAEFNTRNMLFIVSGTFHPREVLAAFAAVLRKPVGGSVVPPSCFTNKRDIIFVPRRDSSSTEISIAFPSPIMVTDPDYLLLSPLTSILNDLLFDVLRTQHALVYGIKLECETTTCGTSAIFNLTVRNANVVKCLAMFYSTLKNFLSHAFPPQRITAAKNVELTRYYKEHPYAHYYTLQYINQLSAAEPVIVTRKQRIHRIMHMSADDLKRTLQHLVDFSKMLLVYQGTTEFRLSSIFKT